MFVLSGDPTTRSVTVSKIKLVLLGKEEVRARFGPMVGFRLSHGFRTAQGVATDDKHYALFMPWNGEQDNKVVVFAIPGIILPQIQVRGTSSGAEVLARAFKEGFFEDPEGADEIQQYAELLAFFLLDGARATLSLEQRIDIPEFWALKDLAISQRIGQGFLEEIDLLNAEFMANWLSAARNMGEGWS